MWWISAAMAQDVLLDDFTGPTLTWGLTNGVTFTVPPNPWDGAALTCDVGSLYGLCEAQSEEFVVTHDTIRFRSTSEPVGGSDTFVLNLSGGVYPVIGLGRPVPGTWDLTELPIVGGCAESGSVYFSATTPPYAVYVPIVYLDDLELGGAVCPEFLDLDGDGGCLQGTDLDGDGVCIQAGEPAPPGVVIDPDEAPDTGSTGDTGSTEPVETADTGGTPGTTEPGETGDTGTVETGAPSDSGVSPSTTDTQEPIDTAEPPTDSTPTDTTPSDAPVHEPVDDDSGGLFVKTEECACGTTGGPSFVGVGLLLAVAGIRRRRSTAP